jgi:Glycosyltransferase family 87
MRGSDSASRVSFSGLFGALQPIAFAVLPVAFTALGLAHYAHRHVLAIDFHRQYWVAGNRVLDGLSPYDRSWQDIYHGVGFPYSSLDALLFVPFGLLPHTAADWTFTALCIAAGMLTLWILGARDWRVYGVALLWAPVVSAWQTGNLTLLLGLGIACAWRARRHPAAVGALVALLVTAKVFLWPLGLWLLATRRYTAIGWGVAVGAVLNVGSWAVIGFDQIGAYKSLGRDITRFDESRSYNLLHLALDHGLGHTGAYALQLLALAATAATCVVVGRRGRDASALTLSVGACLVAAPVIWLHYFALLLVPLGLTRPRLAWVWLLPIVLFACPVHEPSTLELLIALAVAAVVIAASALPDGRSVRIGSSDLFVRRYSATGARSRLAR